MIYTKEGLQLSTTVGQGDNFIGILHYGHIIIFCAILAGESGLVYKAYLNTALGKELVAVKTVKGILYYTSRSPIIIMMIRVFHFINLFALCVHIALFSSSDMERLAKEVSTMLLFEHTNIMSLIGVCIDGEVPLLIMPFMSNGSVLEYVKRNKDVLLCSNAMASEVINPQHACARAT